MTSRTENVAMTFDTSLGQIRLLADSRGLTGIWLPGTVHAPVPAGPPATPGHPMLEQAFRQIKEYLAGKRTAFTLPLAPHGTPFQLRVWEIIRRIPYGQTMTYGQIARLLGHSNKARPVGGAAHANPLPLVIPCHRVVGTNGSLTGFAGGLAMKEKLLRLEADDTNLLG